MNNWDLTDFNRDSACSPHRRRNLCRHGCFADLKIKNKKKIFFQKGSEILPFDVKIIINNASGVDINWFPIDFFKNMFNKIVLKFESSE